MAKERFRFFQNRILLSILLPVLGVGLIISALSISWLTPPLLSFIQERTDAELKLASNFGLIVCENHLNYLLDLRLENDNEMNTALKNEAVKEIKEISSQFHKINMLIIENSRTVLGSSLDPPNEKRAFPKLKKGKSGITIQRLWGNPMRINYNYFPFWKWHIVSFISEREYMAPVLLAKKIVYVATFGLLVSVLFTLFLMFNFFVNAPLKRVIRATEGVAEGRFTKVGMRRRDEVGQLARSFDFMVEILNENNVKVTNLIEALKISEDRFRTIFQTSPDAITINRLDSGIYVDVNETFSFLTGYTRKDVIGRSVLEVGIWHSDKDRERFEEELKKNRHLKNLETEYDLNDGSLLTGLISARIIELEGKPHILSIVRDIRELKQAEDARRESEEKHRTILESIEEGYFEVDIAGDFTFVNDSLCKILGYNNDEIIGLNNRQYMDQQNSKMVYEAFSKLFKTGEPIKSFDLEFIRKDGNKRHIEISVTLVKDSNGKPIGFRGILRDITERKRAEEEKNRLQAQLQKARRMEAIGTLAGGIAHNFNNLLMGIMGNASMVLLDLDFRHPYYKNLKNIEKCVASGSKLTGQLLGYAREGRYELKPISLNRLLKETSETFATARKEIKVHIELSEELYGIKADQGQIEQVLLNLYVNATDAMPRGGDLFLKTMNVTDKDMRDKSYKVTPGKYVMLTVKDSGMGMDKETIKRIFDPFFTTKGLAEGTGLGLASVYGIIKGHGGYIDVESEKGHGTTFIIYLPQTEKRLIEVLKPSGEIVKGRETILLVDDEHMARDAGEQMLKKLGYEVMLAGGGEEGLELYKRNQTKIDIVFLDMVMPDMGGGETYDKLKEINPDVKVLLSSGYSIDGQATEILERGCNGFVQKPFNMKELSEKLREILDNQ